MIQGDVHNYVIKLPSSKTMSDVELREMFSSIGLRSTITINSGEVSSGFLYATSDLLVASLIQQVRAKTGAEWVGFSKSAIGWPMSYFVKSRADLAFDYDSATETVRSTTDKVILAAKWIGGGVVIAAVAIAVTTVAGRIK